MNTGCKGDAKTLPFKGSVSRKKSGVPDSEISHPGQAGLTVFRPKNNNEISGLISGGAGDRTTVGFIEFEQA
jgi:hypothetical protein